MYRMNESEVVALSLKIWKVLCFVVLSVSHSQSEELICFYKGFSKLMDKILLFTSHFFLSSFLYSPLYP